MCPISLRYINWYLPRNDRSNVDLGEKKVPESESSCETSSTSLDLMNWSGSDVILVVDWTLPLEYVSSPAKPPLAETAPVLQESRAYRTMKTNAAHTETRSRSNRGHLLFCITAHALDCLAILISHSPTLQFSSASSLRFTGRRRHRRRFVFSGYHCPPQFSSIISA